MADSFADTGRSAIISPTATYGYAEQIREFLDAHHVIGQLMSGLFATSG